MLKQVGVGRMKRKKIENGPMGVEEAATAAITKTSLESFPEGSVIHSHVILVAFWNAIHRVEALQRSSRGNSDEVTHETRF